MELSPDAAALASRSVTENGLAGRIRVHLADWTSLPPSFEAGGFDRVVCNPPYFAPASGGHPFRPDAAWPGMKAGTASQGLPAARRGC